jgi:hypothetical protein
MTTFPPLEDTERDRVVARKIAKEGTGEGWKSWNRNGAKPNSGKFNASNGPIRRKNRVLLAFHIMTKRGRGGG